MSDLKRYRIVAEVVLYVDAVDEGAANDMADDSFTVEGYVHRIIEIREDDEERD